MILLLLFLRSHSTFVISLVPEIYILVNNTDSYFIEAPRANFKWSGFYISKYISIY